MPAHHLQVITNENRPLPQSPDSERTIIGCVMLDGSLMQSPEVAALEPGDFWSDKHAALWAILRDMDSRGRRIEMVTVVDEVVSRGEAHEVGGLSYITKLPDLVPSVEIAPHCARIVRSRATQRALIRAAVTLTERAYDSTLTMEELADVAAAPQKAIEGRTGVGAWADALALSTDVYQDIEARMGRNTRGGLPIGPEAGMCWLEAGQCWVLAGRPAMGKTGLALQWALSVARAGIGVGYYSLEMPKQTLTRRLVCEMAGVSATMARDGQIDARQLASIRDAADTLSGLPLHMDDTPGLSVQDLRARTSVLARNCDHAGTPLGLIVIDHVGHVRAKGEKRYEQATAVANGLLAAAKHMNVCILQLVQLNRQTANRAGYRPAMSDLRDTGAWEENARGIVLLHRPGYYDGKHPRAGYGEAIVAKQNDGETGSLWMPWEAGAWGRSIVPEGLLPFGSEE